MTAQHHLYHITLLFWLYFAAEQLKKLLISCRITVGVTQCCHGTGAPALSPLIICFGYECQLNACEVEKLCSRHAQSGAKQTDESKLSKERGLLFLSLFFFFQFLLCSLCIKIPWPLLSSKLHLFTCLVIVQSHCFYHLPTPFTDHAG